MDSVQKMHAGQIRSAALARGLGSLGAVLGIACAGAESSLRNIENGGRSVLIDRATGKQITPEQRAVARRSLGLGDYLPAGDNLDSLGLFAQRPSQGWGTPEQIMQPFYAIGKFFDRLAGIEGWRDLPEAEVIARVQGFYDPAVYSSWLATARSLI